MAVFDFIEGWSNPHRRHSALDYVSPNDFERDRGGKASGGPAPAPLQNLDFWNGGTPSNLKRSCVHRSGVAPENLHFGNPKASDEAVREALQEAEAWRLLEARRGYLATQR